MNNPLRRLSRAATPGRAVALQRALSTGYLRPYTNADVIGTEIGGACKNVIALACGMAAGVGLGRTPPRRSSPRSGRDHAVGNRIGAKPATLAGLAGVGDLVATCTSPHSRNRSFGERLGRGESVDAATRRRRGPSGRGSDVVYLGLGAGCQLRRGDAAHRCGVPGVPSRFVRRRSGGAVARSHYQAGMSAPK